MAKTCSVDPSLVAPAAKHCGIETEMACDIITMVICLRTNAEILDHIKQNYGLTGKGHSVIRAINPLIKSFIIHNYPDHFRIFCSENKVSLFDDDLESQKRHASHARMMCVVFLRNMLLAEDIPS